MELESLNGILEERGVRPGRATLFHSTLAGLFQLYWATELGVGHRATLEVNSTGQQN